jgi:glycosyltransferase involved in cell wall biosynthesis
MARIVIVQPYLPAYRRPLFNGVVEKLRAAGHDCVVVTGRLSRKRAGRGDSVSAPWLVTHRGFSTKIRGHHVRTYESWRDWRGSDVLVMELATGSIDTFLGLLLRRSRKVILWGHVGHQTGHAAAGSGAALGWQLRSADSVLAYTQAGKVRAEQGGARRAVSLDNTVDTRGLAGAVRKLRQEKVSAQTIDRSKTFAYIGGLDRSKRIDFLAEALDHMWERDPAIRLIVGGRGADENLLSPAVERGQVVLLGRVDEHDKAAMAVECSLLLCPGRVGLISVESFTLGLPIVTTEWPYHAPEFEYLSVGTDSIVTKDDPAAYAEAVIGLANEPLRVQALAAAAQAKSGWPSIDHMIDTFVAECLRQINLPATPATSTTVGG